MQGTTTISPELAAHFLANPHLLKQEILNNQMAGFQDDSQNQSVKDEQKDDLNETPTEILALRTMYPDLIHNNNENENNWYCDICLDSGDHDNENEDAEDLAICEMCLVVVHPGCYRRELYEQDPDDESPWYC